jgi:hypothetical protein
MHNNSIAKAEAEFEYFNGTLVGRKSGKELKIMPYHIKEKIKLEDLKELKIKDSEADLRYFVKTEKIGKFLWIFPVTIEKIYEIDATTGGYKK